MHVGAARGRFPTEPWGRYRPPPLSRAAIRATRALAFPVLKQAALAIRRLVRPRLDFVDVELWGQKVRMAARGNLAEGRLIFVPRAWDRAERETVARHLRPGARFVDVGSNAGGYLWWVLSLLGRDCRILAVEPDPDLVASLRFNLATNGATHVRLEPMAVGVEPGRGILVPGRANRGENRVEPRAGDAAGEGGGHVEVPVRRLEDLVRSAGFEGVDVMKIDIEGLEVPVLRDFYSTAPRELWPRLLLTERKDTPAHDELEVSLVARGYAPVLRTRRNLALRRRG